MINDFTFILQWWFLFFVIGIIFLPLTTLLFSSFIDRGYIFSKIIGMAFVSYMIFVLGILKILPFTLPTIFLVVGLFVGINIFIIKTNRRLTIEELNNKTMRIFILEELLFLATLTFWSYVRGFQPDIHGLEKYMDFGFINSIIRSEYFPPKDMWFTPFSINYYYFGHLLTAVLTKASLLPSHITYNLMLATIFAFTFTGSFSIGVNIFSSNVILNSFQDLKKKGFRNKFGMTEKGPLIAGLLTAFLVSFAGNLHTIYTFFKPYLNDNPVPFWQLQLSLETFPNSYWYPNATRFIHNTIHEFPMYSFVVSDLHGHVLDIPFVLLTIAVLLSLIQNYNSKLKNLLGIPLLSFLIAVMYMTNVWDGIIYALLTFFVFFYLAYRSKNFTLYALRFTLVIIGSILFSLPFSLHFKPFVSGIGILCAPEFLTAIGKFGPFLFEPDHCQRSPLWQLFILHGFFYFWIISFIIFIKKLNAIRYTLYASEIFVLLLILLSTLLIIIPEFIYAKDIYPAHYRANTMFKLVYQSFIMLSISSGYIIIRLISPRRSHFITPPRWPNGLLGGGRWKFVYLFIGGICLLVVLIYPYFAVTSYYGNLQTYYGLDGTAYLKKLYATDYEAITWLNKNIKGQPVILEAQGDSYTDYARVSTHTGLTTVLGWTVHEWLWRGSYDIPSPRITEIQTLYDTKNLQQAKQFIKKYKIELIFIGNLESQKYPNLIADKFEELGKLIYQNGQTKIYRMRN